MNSATQNLNPQPVNAAGLRRLPVQFGADFPVEFTIRRLEDVPLRLVLEELKIFQMTHQQP